MKSNLLASSASIAFVVLGPCGALADVIVDPDGTGATRVFPDISGGDLSTAFRDDITVGYSGVPGAFELNAENRVNGVTRLINVDNLQISQFGPDEAGEVRVIGNGAPGSAGIDLRGDFRLGANSDSLLRIENGGEVIHTPDPLERGFYDTEKVYIGSYADFRPGTGSAEVVIDGAGSRLVTMGGNYRLGAFNAGEVDRTTVSNGGLLDVKLVDTPEDYDLLSSRYEDPVTGEERRFNEAYFDGLVTVGATDFVDDGGTIVPILGPADVLTVTGSGSELRFSSILRTNGNAEIVVSDGGAIRHVEEFRGDGAAYVDLYYDSYNPFLEAFDFDAQSPTSIELVNGDDITLTVTGAGSRVEASRDVRIGGFGADAAVTVDAGGHLSAAAVNVSSAESGGGSGRLTVAAGGVVEAGYVEIFEGGLLDGDGGTLAADVFLSGGTIGPGASPGTMTIDGNLEIFDGLLQIEIAGTGAGMFDMLNVTGDLIVADMLDIEISFLDDFMPSESDVFNFLNVAGAAPIFDTPSLINLTVTGGGTFGSDARLDIAGGTMTLVGDGVTAAPVPVPAALPMLLAGLAGLGWAGHRRRA
jgi:T5SS/PEP-CTERM-associated repeat protein